MTPETKAICEMERAAKTCRNWKSASVIELQEACRYVPGALLLLIRRMAMELGTPNIPICVKAKDKLTGQQKPEKG
jgi:hypothetical protein